VQPNKQPPPRILEYQSPPAGPKVDWPARLSVLAPLAGLLICPFVDATCQILFSSLEFMIRQRITFAEFGLSVLFGFAAAIQSLQRSSHNAPPLNRPSPIAMCGLILNVFAVLFMALAIATRKL